MIVFIFDYRVPTQYRIYFRVSQICIRMKKRQFLKYNNSEFLKVT